MTVDQLRTILAHLPGDLLVVLSGDDEGNKIGVLSDISSHNYCFDVDDDGCGYIGPCVLTAKLAAFGYTEDDLVDCGKECVVLWP